VKEGGKEGDIDAMSSHVYTTHTFTLFSHTRCTYMRRWRRGTRKRRGKNEGKAKRKERKEDAARLCHGRTRANERRGKADDERERGE